MVPDHVTIYGPIWGYAFSADGCTLATASDDGTVQPWVTATGRTRATLTGHTGAMVSVAFSRDEHTLATGSKDNTVRLWKLELLDQTAAMLPPYVSQQPAPASADSPFDPYGAGAVLGGGILHTACPKWPCMDAVQLALM